jgi:dTDP-4-amino-4,6-dideoxygalactose transaminase
MLVTHRGDQDRARLLRWHGLSRRTKADFRCEQDITEVGGKHHMTDLNAAIGLANIDHAEWIVARHRLSAEWYCRVLRGCPGITVPPYGPGSSYWLMGLLVEDRDGFASYMTSHGVQVSRAHRRNDEHTAFRAVSWGWPLPGVEYFDAHQINIPAGWWVSEQDREYVAAVITDWAHGRREAA